VVQVNSKLKILVIDDQPSNIDIVKSILSEEYTVLAAVSGSIALQIIKDQPPDLILLDIIMPEMDGYEVCRQIKTDEAAQDIPILFLTAKNETSDEVLGFDLGAVDYIVKPVNSLLLQARVRTHLKLAQTQQLEAECVYLSDEIKLMHDYGNIIGQSEVMQYVFYNMKQIAPTDTTVFIQGESGTGKELIARAIHHESKRNELPLIKVDCSSLPVNLIESELFGHEKGAFTSASEKRIGRFELADRGTIFLDEIGELPLELQPKLLRILQEGEFERLGSSKTRHTNVRVIAATNRNLEEEVKQGRFRKDLWYRINVFPLTVPPLRERGTDITLLANWMIQKHQRRLDKQIKRIPTEVLDEMQSYAWPGNVRELQNVIERSVIVTTGDKLKLACSLKVTEKEGDTKAGLAKDAPIKTLAELEKEHILRVLTKTNWKVLGKGGAAEILGLNGSTLRGRMRKHKISRPTP
jgi:DNA-binding NtrC family response regulator